jgi:hypothetical protein
VVPVTLPDLSPVAEDVMSYFRRQGFDVTGTKEVQGWHISITKGAVFKAVLGMRTALNIELQPDEDGTMVKAGVGIFGRQVVPILVARFVFWPVWLTQIWGLVQQARLDDEALDYAERRLRTRATRITPAEPTPAGAAADPAAGEPAPGGRRFCTACGALLPEEARFCSRCGARAD